MMKKLLLLINLNLTAAQVYVQQQPQQQIPQQILVLDNNQQYMQPSNQNQTQAPFIIQNDSGVGFFTYLMIIGSCFLSVIAIILAASLYVVVSDKKALEKFQDEFEKNKNR
jgi:uncharacterized protein HemX